MVFVLPLNNGKNRKKLFKVCFLAKLDNLLFSLSLYDSCINKVSEYFGTIRVKVGDFLVFCSLKI